MSEQQLILDLCDFAEQVLEAAREQTTAELVVRLAENCEGFARPSLPIREDRSVVAEQALIDDLLSDRLEDVNLGCVLASDVVEGEALLRDQSDGLVVITGVCDAPSNCR